MLCHYYTLFHLSRELDVSISGAVIEEVYSQEKNQLCLSVAASEPWTVVVSCEPSRNYVYSRKGYSRSRRNSVDVLRALPGRHVNSVLCHPNDRVLLFRLDGNVELRCELFASRANVLLYDTSHDSDGDRQVLDAFLRRSTTIGVLVNNGIPDLSRRTVSQFDVLSAARTMPDVSILQALRHAIPLLGTTLGHEALHRAAIEPSTHVSALPNRDIERIAALAFDLLSEAASPQRRPAAIVYSEQGIPLSLSLIPLRSHQDAARQDFSTVAEAVQRFVIQLRGASSFLRAKQATHDALARAEKKVHQTLAKLDDAGGRNSPEQYERIGKLLMAHLPLLRKGMKVLSLRDEGSTLPEPVRIILDPALNPVQNAERYFLRSKKARAARDEAHRRRPMLEEFSAHLGGALAELDDVQSPLLLRHFRELHGSLLSRIGISALVPSAPPLPFRAFTVEGGFTVLAGRNNENNDLLTFKYAKPGDLWFHCRASSGSHVVLKRDSGRGEPSRIAIEQTAAIAGYYSKMKRASMVPVVMTERKYVRKPKGAPAGAVSVEREKVLFVNPALPVETKEE